jgi:sulfite exporter TauE/SafE
MWITALLMGFVGSLHCLGMCSPLVMVITQRQPFPVSRLVYNLGRIVTYSILGYIAASFGTLFNISGWQQVISVAMGVILISIGITGASQFRIPFLVRGVHRFSLLIRNSFATFLSLKSSLVMFALGALNGLLPCGLIYIAMAYCVSLTPTQGMTFMSLFGAATLPVMFGVPSLFAQFVHRLKVSFRIVTAVILILTGTLLLARVYFVKDNLHRSLFNESKITICL